MAGRGSVRCRRVVRPDGVRGVYRWDSGGVEQVVTSREILDRRPSGSGLPLDRGGHRRLVAGPDGTVLAANRNPLSDELDSR